MKAKQKNKKKKEQSVKEYINNCFELFGQYKNGKQPSRKHALGSEMIDLKDLTKMHLMIL